MPSVELKDATLMASLVNSKAAFTPAVNIKADLVRLDELAPFEFSPKAASALRLILDSCGAGVRERAFSVVGSYGTGKSSLGLLVAALLGEQREHSWVRESITALHKSDPDAARAAMANLEESPFAVLAVEPDSHSLAEAILSSAAALKPSKWVSPSTKRLFSDVARSSSTNRSAMHLLRVLLQDAKKAGFRGLLLVCDEFGRFLDQASGANSPSNLALAQDIAELAHRTDAPQLQFLLFLHQNLEAYRGALSRQQQAEWSKIQGRFRQISYTEDAEVLAEVVAQSIAHDRKISPEIDKWAGEQWTSIKDLAPFAGNRLRWKRLVGKAYPLHPLTLAALPHLASLLGQHERTLFTFLNSDTPHGLRQFLRRAAAGHGEPTLGLDEICDYFLLSQDTVAIPRPLHRQLSILTTALERLSDDNGNETRLVKTIGVLGLVAGRSDLWPKRGTIAAALDIRRDQEWVSLERTLKELSDRKILVERRYADEFYLWGGSDFDIDEAFENASMELGSDFDVAGYLQTNLTHAPVVARRHGFQTGTVRSFELHFKNRVERGFDSGSLPWRERADEADGAIQVAFSNDGGDRRTLGACPRPTIAIRPANVSTILEVAREVAVLESLLELDQVTIDPVAAKEISLRLEAGRRTLRRLVEQVLRPSDDAASWLIGGRRKLPTSDRELQAILSDLCDTYYSDAPNVRNELINRRHLSTSVVVAVKKIIGALLEGQGQPGLGFSGNGPEVSIFRAVFEGSGIYRATSGRTFDLVRPSRNSTLFGTWIAIEQFLAGARSAPRPLSELLLQLSLPPFGIRAGLSPLVVFGCLIATRSHVCLYERGTYLPDWSPELYDRVVRRPEEFSVRYFDPEGGVADSISRLHRSIEKRLGSSCRSGTGVNAFLQDLYTWYRGLPDYTRRTQAISPRAAAVRRALGSASDPIEFVSSQLPDALGVVDPQKKLDLYVRRFNNVVRELDEAYASLLQELLSSLCDHARTERSLNQLRQHIETIAQQDLALSDPTTKVFVTRGGDASQEAQGWIESVAAGVIGQPPNRWSVHEADEFREHIPLIFDRIRAAQRARHLANSPKETVRLIFEGNAGVVVDEVFEDKSGEREIDDVVQELYPLIERLPRTSRLRALAALVRRAAE